MASVSGPVIRHLSAPRRISRKLGLCRCACGSKFVTGSLTGSVLSPSDGTMDIVLPPIGSVLVLSGRDPETSWLED